MSNSNRNPASRQGTNDGNRGKINAERTKSEKIEHQVKENESQENYPPKAPKI